MEGIHQLPEASAPKSPPQPRPWWAYGPALAVAALAYLLHYLPVPPFRVAAGQAVRYPFVCRRRRSATAVVLCLTSRLPIRLFL
jgi:hypothetical protein